ncbi:glucose-6-phosphate isomerase [Aestuariispira ectoiniformans]|uniref:glucose-6-phosphate isomerase n=1 Tax=Aestuariispira ectoiniformans TaxID=2775080 RepID=UPI00223C50A1|nr:glucose-6-phosphate isomerase [Aestuariispira ectoiniformans]
MSHGRIPYNQEIDNCLSEQIGDVGITNAELGALLDEAQGGLAKVKQAYESDSLPILKLPAQQADLDPLRPIAEHYRTSFKDVVILGTGGSSLGGRALHEMAYPRRGGGTNGAPNLHIVTNVDPFSFYALFQRLNPETTGVIVISKSGGTTETVMQFLAILPGFREVLGDAALKNHFTVITEPKDNPLRRLGERFSLPVLDHDPKVGGRYSVLSLVGMLPAMISGLDPMDVRGGAQTVLEQSLAAAHPSEALPAIGAAINVGLARHRNVTSAVMLAYSDRLGSLARWYRQLWAESLGKKGQGTTPIYGTGPVDQHSQLQLWLDGPKDKMFTVLGGPIAHGSEPIQADLADDPKLSYMVGSTLGDLMDASRRATAETLAHNGCPVRLITIGDINENSVGALMMHFMLETILAAHLMQVDPFDQPAVEHGKVLTRRYLADMNGHS